MVVRCHRLSPGDPARSEIYAISGITREDRLLEDILRVNGVGCKASLGSDS